MNRKDIGNIIKTRRKSLNISQQILAELSEVGINTLVAMERGTGNYKIGTLLSVLNTLGLQVKITLKD